MLFELLHHYLDGLLELRVAARSPCGGLEIDFDVRRDAVVFDFPLAARP
jgi:hypothetical protein